MAATNFGLHLTIDIENCDAKKLVDNKFIYGLLDGLPDKIGMIKMTLPYVVWWKDKFANTPGLSGFVMIAESHIAIHTFPDNQYTFFDIFSCKHFEIEPIISYIKKQFDSDKVTVNTIKRGKNFMKN